MSNRTRTKRTNGRSPLHLSTIKPDEFNVREGELKSIVCLDCLNWQLVTGATTLKVVGHNCTDLGRDARDGSRRYVDEEHREVRCPGSLQVVVVDIDVRRWTSRQNRLLREAVPAETRRAARQFYKPLPPVATPVHTIAARPMTAAEHERRQGKSSPVRRGQQWREVLPQVKALNSQRRELPAGCAVIGPIKSVAIPSAENAA